jgi:hypothetical protein
MQPTAVGGRVGATALGEECVEEDPPLAAPPRLHSRCSQARRRRQSPPLVRVRNHHGHGRGGDDNDPPPAAASVTKSPSPTVLSEGAAAGTGVARGRGLGPTARSTPPRGAAGRESPASANTDRGARWKKSPPPRWTAVVIATTSSSARGSEGLAEKRTPKEVWVMKTPG